MFEQKISTAKITTTASGITHSVHGGMLHITTLVWCKWRAQRGRSLSFSWPCDLGGRFQSYDNIMHLVLIDPKEFIEVLATVPEHHKCVENLG